MTTTLMTAVAEPRLAVFTGHGHTSEVTQW